MRLEYVLGVGNILSVGAKCDTLGLRDLDTKTSARYGSQVSRSAI